MGFLKWVFSNLGLERERESCERETQIREDERNGQMREKEEKIKMGTKLYFEDEIGGF